MKSNLCFFFSFYCLYFFLSYPRNYYQVQYHKALPLFFLLRVQVFALTFWSLIHIEVTFIHNINKVSAKFCFCADIQFYQYHLLKILSFPYWIVSAPCHLTMYVGAYFWDVYFTKTCLSFKVRVYLPLSKIITNTKVKMFISLFPETGEMRKAPKGFSSWGTREKNWKILKTKKGRGYFWGECPSSTSWLEKANSPYILMFSPIQIPSLLSVLLLLCPCWSWNQGLLHAS